MDRCRGRASGSASSTSGSVHDSPDQFLCTKIQSFTCELLNTCLSREQRWTVDKWIKTEGYKWTIERWINSEAYGWAIEPWIKSEAYKWTTKRWIKSGKKIMKTLLPFIYLFHRMNSGENWCCVHEILNMLLSLRIKPGVGMRNIKPLIQPVIVQ